MADDKRKPGPGTKAPEAAEAEPKTAAAPAAPPVRLAFTIDAATGEMISVEAVDEAGARRELSGKEKASLAKEIARHSLEDILEQTFEAGIASVLGDGDDGEETADDAELRHMIVGPMLARSAARRFLREEVLAPAILGALIQHHGPANGAPQARPGERRRTQSTSSHRPPPRAQRH